MRSIEKIKADIAEYESGSTALMYAPLIRELRAAIISDIPLDQLETMCSAWKDGRRWIAPCKVGDAVYKIQKASGRILKRTVKTFGFVQGEWWVGVQRGNSFPVSAIGKTVFITPEAAAEALKGGAV